MTIRECSCGWKKVTFKIHRYWCRGHSNIKGSLAESRQAKSTTTIPSKLLYGPTKKPLNTTGHFTCNLSHKLKQQIFVADDLKTSYYMYICMYKVGLCDNGKSYILISLNLSQ